MNIVLNLMLFGQSDTYYKDCYGTEVHIPKGEKSFADNVSYYRNGDPPARGDNTTIFNAVGTPDYDGNSNNKKSYLSLGCGGEAIFEFTDNALININGPDLYVFEIGQGEAYEVYISKNKQKWYYIGRSKGGPSEFDIKKKAHVEDKFFYVRIVDLNRPPRLVNGNGGADIDAVAAIGSIPSSRFKLESPPEKKTAEKEVVSEESENEYVKTNADSILITLWDGQQEDNDKISLFHNDVKIVDSKIVSQDFYKFYINLVEGKNTFKLFAENQGDLGINSAALKISYANFSETVKLKNKTGEFKVIEIEK